MPPKATPGPTWPYQCTLDKSQLAKGINSSHCLLSKVFRSKFSPKILITFSSHRDVGFNCVSPVCSHCCSLNCIHRMFCLSVACTTFHCPSPPIPGHFPALNTARAQHCILGHTAPQCILGAYYVLYIWHFTAYSIVNWTLKFVLESGALQRCSISARSKPFPRLRR